MITLSGGFAVAGVLVSADVCIKGAGTFVSRPLSVDFAGSCAVGLDDMAASGFDTGGRVVVSGKKATLARGTVPALGLGRADNVIPVSVVPEAIFFAGGAGFNL
jgi:hypothetical protein